MNENCIDLPHNNFPFFQSIKGKFHITPKEITDFNEIFFINKRPFFKYISSDQSKEFLKYYKYLQQLVFEMDTLLPKQLPYLKTCQKNAKINLTRKQVALLFLLSFFNLINITNKKCNFFNISNVLKCFSYAQFEFCKCFINYLTQIGKWLSENNPILNETITYVRDNIDNNNYQDKELCEIKIYEKGSLFEGDASYCVDFANKYIGGGVLKGGSVQEEILFAIEPEAIVSLCFMEIMDKNDAIGIFNTIQYSKYKGYGENFKFDGNAINKDLNKIIRHKIIAIDALPQKKAKDNNNTDKNDLNNNAKTNINSNINNSNINNYNNMMMSNNMSNSNIMNNNMVNNNMMIGNNIMNNSMMMGNNIMNNNMMMGNNIMNNNMMMNNNLSNMMINNNMLNNNMMMNNNMLNNNMTMNNNYSNIMMNNRMDNSYNMLMNNNYNNIIMNNRMINNYGNNMMLNNNIFNNNNMFNNNSNNMINSNIINNSNNYSNKEKEEIKRDIHKAYVGFNLVNLEQNVNEKTIATGNWGCGAFGGNHQLKFIQQWIAASLAGIKRLDYYTFGNEKMKDIQNYYNSIKLSFKTANNLYNTILNLNLYDDNIIKNLIQSKR